MRYTIAILLSMLFWAGCTQAIGPSKKIIYYPDRIEVIEKPWKFNSLFKSFWSKNFSYDPKGLLCIGDITGIPADIAFEYDPITKKLGIKTKSHADPNEMK